MLSSEENWYSISSCTEALLKSKKFDWDERRRMEVYTASQISLSNQDADMNMKAPNVQMDSTGK